MPDQRSGGEAHGSAPLVVAVLAAQVGQYVVGPGHVECVVVACGPGFDDGVPGTDVHVSVGNVALVGPVGRALRMQPGEGKIASLVVPVFLAPGESPDDMLTSRGGRRPSRRSSERYGHMTRT